MRFPSTNEPPCPRCNQHSPRNICVKYETVDMVINPVPGVDDKLRAMYSYEECQYCRNVINMRFEGVERTPLPRVLYEGCENAR